MIHPEDFSLVYVAISELSYKDYNDPYIYLFLNTEMVGKLEVWTDRNNNNREYVIINHEIIHLDTIKNERIYI